MIFPRRPMTPRIQCASEATKRGSVKRMISCTAPIGRAYSSFPSEKTTSCWEVISDMSLPHRPSRRGALGVRGKAHDEARAAAVERRLQADVALVALRHRAHDREPESRG